MCNYQITYPTSTGIYSKMCRTWHDLKGEIRKGLNEMSSLSYPDIVKGCDAIYDRLMCDDMDSCELQGVTVAKI